MAKPRTASSSPLFVLAASITTIAALYFAKDILLPLGLAILLTFLLTPLANRIERLGIGRIASSLLIVILSFTVLGTVGWIVTAQLIDLRYRLPNYQSNVIDKMHSVMPSSQTINRIKDGLNNFRRELTGVDGAQPAPTDTEAARAGSRNEADREATKVTVDTQSGSAPPESVQVKVVEPGASPLYQVHSWLGPVLAPIGTAGMVVVLAFFILLDREDQRDRLLQLFGTSNLHATTEAMRDAGTRVGRYLRMQFLVNACYGVIISTGLWFIGVPSASLWGVLCFALRFVPYIGPWIAALAPIVVSLGASEGWRQPALVVAWFLTIELVCNNVIEPWLYGSTTGVSLVGVMLSALFWTWLWGPIGLILSMPITVCLVVAARYVPQLRFITVLLADRPPLSDSERTYQRLLAFDDREPLKLARHHLKGASLLSFYDDVLIPALVLAEHDRHADLLNDDQEHFVEEAAEDLVEELGEHAKHAAAKAVADADTLDDRSHGAPDGQPLVVSARVLCVPLRDKADEITGHMLAQLLTAEGFHAETDTTDALTGETVDRVLESDIDVVVISVLPPITLRDSRLLWKRLRMRYPSLPIVVGFWSVAPSTDLLAVPENDSLSRIVTSLADAIAAVRAIAVQQHVTAKTG